MNRNVIKNYLALIMPSFVVVALLTILLSGISVSIYSDEIAMHISHSRAIFDDLIITGLFPQCQSTWLRSPFWFEYPAILINYLTRPSSDPVIMRITGIAYALLWFFLMYFFCGKTIKNKSIKFCCWVFLLSVCALGVLPYVMILARSEQILLFSISFVSVLSLFFPLSLADSARVLSLKSIVFFSTVSVFYFSHPKSIFFSPLVFISLYFFLSGIKAYQRLLAMVVLLVITIQKLVAAISVTGCSEAPWVAKMLASNVIDLSLWRTPMALLGQMLTNSSMVLDQIIYRLSFDLNYQSAWLPSFPATQLPASVMKVNSANQFAMHAFFYFGATFIVLSSSWSVIKRTNVPRHLLALSLLIGLVINAALYSKNAWNFYTPGLMIPLFGFAVLLALPDFFNVQRKHLYLLYSLATPFYLLAILNLSVLAFTVLPNTFRVAQQGSSIIDNQFLSAPVFLSDDSRKNFDELMKLCGFPESDSYRLAVDGAAYGYLKNMHQPIDVLYVAVAYGMDIPDLGKFLHNLNSDGILSRCDYLPATIVDRSQKINNMCCLSRNSLLN